MRFLCQKVGAHLRFRAAAYLVLALALVPTGIAYWRVSKNVQFRDEARFNVIASKAEETIRNNLEGLTAELLAVSGFFETRGTVTRAEWDGFIAKLELDRRHPGLRSVGFSERIETASAAAFVARVRRDLIDPGYDIFPKPTEPIAFPTVYVTQFPTNIDARRGWDSYSEPLRRRALDSVAQTHRPAVTGKTAYWNKDAPLSEGFTIFVPVTKGVGTNREMAGVIFSSFIPQHLFNLLAARRLDSSVSVELFDGAATQREALLGHLGTGSGQPHVSFVKTLPIRLLDHVFLLRVTTLPEFDTLSERQLPRAVLACALGLSFLLFSIAWRQASARTAAEKVNRRLIDSEERLRAANIELERRIAEARTAEELLAYERDLLRTLLDHSPDGIYFKDRESRFIKCGHAVLAHLDLDAVADAAGKTDFDFFSEEHARAAFETEQEIMRTGQPVIGLIEKETWPGGGESWVLTSKMPLRDKHGNIIGTFGISKDITKLKAAEFALEKEKELLAVTLRSIGDGVITTDVEGRIVLFNEVARQLTGWANADAAGQPLEKVFKTRNGESSDRGLQQDLKEGALESESDGVLVARDGTARNVSHSVAPIIDRTGQKIGAVLVFRDVTEKLKTQAELEKASKLESIGVLAGGIAHDFNNILTVILGNISLARMMPGDEASVQQSLEEAEKASMRARELTQRLLTFAKGGAPIKKPLDLSPVMRACATRALQGTKVVPKFFIAGGLWPVHADESQICQVVQNVIGYTRASISQEPRLDIHVLNQEIASDPLLLLKPGRYVRVSIRDYGTGIDPEHLTKIFEPYFGARSQGSGLELATAYSIVRKHDGQIRVESISGQGTVFHIYLPAAAEAIAPARRMPQAPRAQAGPKRVLVMDDELPVRKLAVLLLQRIGYTAATAADGAEAIELYEAARKDGEPFDVVIMDLTVPNGMGGKQAIQQLKALDPDAVAIVSSGYSNDPVMANFRDFGFSGVVPKPYSTEDLAAVLEELFARDVPQPAETAAVA